MYLTSIGKIVTLLNILNADPRHSVDDTVYQGLYFAIWVLFLQGENNKSSIYLIDDNKSDNGHQQSHLLAIYGL